MVKIALKLNKVSPKMAKIIHKLVSVATSAGNLIKILLPAHDPTGNYVARIHHFFLVWSSPYAYLSKKLI